MVRWLIGVALASVMNLQPAEAGAPLPAGMRLFRVASGFSDISGVYQPNDGSGRLFVIEQTGRIKIVLGGSTQAQNFLRLCNAAVDDCFVPPGGFHFGGEQGLLGLAFHPQFASNRQVFLHYVASQGRIQIARVLASDTNPGVADIATFTRLIDISADFGYHNGGQLMFGPDGYLYIGVGDGGAGNDGCSRAQTVDPARLCSGVSNDGQPGCPSNSSCGPASRGPNRALLGKLLRIDVDATTPAGTSGLCAANPDGSAGYAVPADNPHTGSGPGCDEIWLHGLRNPWRFSFDRDTGDMLIGDVGQGSREEVTLFPASGTGSRNLGWRCRQGSELSWTGPPVCNAPPAFLDPVLDYPNGPSGRCAIIGGYRYRGPASTLDGLYFFGDYCEGRILIAHPGTGPWPISTWTQYIGAIRTFGEGINGDVYVGTETEVFRIGGHADAATLYQHGFEAEVMVRGDEKGVKEH